MGEIRIIDSGFIKTDNSGTQASTSNMSNDGLVILLKTASFTPSLKRNIDDSPDVSSNTPSEVNLGSLENMKFSLNCILNRNISDDMQIAEYLYKLITTNGYKLLWYDYSDADIEGRNLSLLYRTASQSLFGNSFTDDEMTFWNNPSGQITTKTNHLHVHFFDIQIRETGKDGSIRYTLSGIVLPVPTITNNPGA